MGYPEDQPEYAAKEARKSRLPLSEQDKTIAELQEAVNILVDRLQPVLTPSEPTDKASEERAVPVQSEVASTLNDNNARIHRVTNKVNNAIGRLEV
jgi:hypothetical protein